MTRSGIGRRWSEMRCQLEGRVGSRACDEEPKDRLFKTEMFVQDAWLLLYSSRKKRQTRAGEEDMERNLLADEDLCHSSVNY